MTDIVERLRVIADDPFLCQQVEVSDDLRFAADEIERLRAVIDRAAKAWLSIEGIPWEGDVGDAMAAAVKEIERLRADLRQSQQEHDRATAFHAIAVKERDLERLQVDRLRAERDAAIKMCDKYVEENQRISDERDGFERELLHANDGIVALEKERDALREDAERYRWLRRTLHSAVGGGVEVNDMKLVYEDPKPNEEVRVYWYPDTPVGFYEQKGSTLDAAIDAARKN